MAYEGRGPEDRSREQMLARAAAAVRRARLLGALALLLVSVGLGGAVILTWQYQRMKSETCATWQVIDIPIDEIIALKRRKEAYQVDASPNAVLSLTGPEITFVMQDMLDYGVRVDFIGDEVDATVTLPTDGGCWNIQYRGEFEVRDGVAILRPERLVVGDVELSPYLPTPIAIRPEDLQGRVDGRIPDALDNTESLAVEGDRVTLRLRDPWRLW